MKWNHLTRRIIIYWYSYLDQIWVQTKYFDLASSLTIMNHFRKSWKNLRDYKIIFFYTFYNILIHQGRYIAYPFWKSISSYIVLTLYIHRPESISMFIYCSKTFAWNMDDNSMFFSKQIVEVLEYYILRAVENSRKVSHCRQVTFFKRATVDYYNQW